MNLDYKGGVVADRRALDVAQTAAPAQTARRSVVAMHDSAAKGFPQYDTLVSGRDAKLMASPMSVRFDKPLVPAWTAQVHRATMDDWLWRGGFAFAPNGSIVTTGGEGHIETWDLATGKPRAGFIIKDPGHVGDCIAIDHQGKIATDGHQRVQHSEWAGVPFFWAPVGARQETDRQHRHLWLLTSLAWLPDGRLASACGGGSLQVWEPSGDVRTLCNWGDPPPINAMTAIAVLPMGRVIGGSKGGSVRIWNAATGECERTVDHGDDVVAVGPGPDGTFFSAGGHRCTLWAADGSVIRSNKTKGRYILGSGVVAADGTMLTGSKDGLRVFDARGKRTQLLRTDAQVCRIAIGPRGALVTATSDGKLTRWANR